MLLISSSIFFLTFVFSAFCDGRNISHGYLDRVDPLNSSASLAPTRINNTTNGTVVIHKGNTPGPQSAKASTPATQSALLPTVHWDHHAGNIHHLAPQHSHDFYYAAGGLSDPSVEHTFAQISSNMSHPCVVLDHSAHVQSVTYGPRGLRIKFTSSTAFEYAKSSWSSTPSFIIATNTDGVGATNDQRSFWLVRSFKSQNSENCITADVHEELPIGEVMEEVAVVWGSYKPDQEPKHSGYISSAPATGGSPKPNYNFAPYGASGNSSGANGHTTNNTCGRPPKSEIDGFPTAVCGSPTFDKDLDNKIGYLGLEDTGDETDLQRFAPGLKDFSASTNVRRATVHRRVLTKFVTRIGNVLQSGAQKVKGRLVEGATVAFSTAKKIGQVVSDIASVSPSINTDLPINLTPTNLTSSPWGEALELYRKEKSSKGGTLSGEVTVYCVQCGVTGKIHLRGEARWTLANGLTKANMGMDGNLGAGLQIGVDAQAELKKEFQFKILQKGIETAPPVLSVSGLFTIGPQVSLYATVDLGVTLAGQVLAGVKMSIPDFAANVDLVDGSKSSMKGFTPQFEKIFGR